MTLKLINGSTRKTVELGGGDNSVDNTAEPVPLTVLLQVQDAAGSGAGEGRRYPG